VTKRKGISGCYVEWYDDTKRRRSRYFSPKHKKYVKPFLARKFAELNSDVRSIHSPISLIWSNFVNDYLRHKEAGGISPNTLKDIKCTIKTFTEACQPTTTASITPDAIIDYRLHLQKQGLSQNTINKHLRNLKAMCNWGKQRHYISPDIQITKTKSSPKQPRILSDTEVRELLIACGDDPHWRMRILLALCTGLRRGDIDNLKLSDINLQFRTITCRNQKTGKITNYQPLPDALMPELERYITEHIEEGQTRLLKTKWSKKWYRIVHRAGLDGLTFHDLRKTFGSRQADAGVSIKTVQEMYQHASVETTLRHYIRTNDTEKRRGVNSLAIEEWLADNS